MRAELERKRDEVDSLIAALDAFYGLRKQERAVMSGLGKVKKQVQKKIEATLPSETRASVYQYLAQHPKSRSMEIAAALGLTRTAVIWHLRKGRKLGQVVLSGSRSSSRWSAK